MQFKSLKIIYFLGLLLAILLMSGGTVIAQQKEAAEDAAKAKEEEAPPKLAELVHMASEFDERFNDLQREIGLVYDLTAAEKSYASITEKLEELTERVEKLKSTKNPTYQDLAELKAAIRENDGASENQIETLTTAINKVESWRTEWLEARQSWTKWQTMVLKTVSIKTVEATFAKAQETITEALDTISKHLEPLLVAQQKGEKLRYRIRKLAAEVDGLILAIRGDMLQKKPPMMFSSRFFGNLRRGLSYELPKSLRISWPGREFFAEEAWVISFQILLSLMIAMVIIRHRKRLKEMQRWQFVVRRPFATGLTFAIPILSGFYGPIPATWWLLLWTVAGISLSRLIGGMTADRWKRRLIYGLAGIVIINQILTTVRLPLPLMRLWVFWIALIGVLFFVWRSVKRDRQVAPETYGWVLRIAALLLLVVLIAEIVGQTIFATQLFDGSVRTISFVLLAWMLITLIRGGLALVVKSPAFQEISFLKENADVMLHRLMFLVQFFVWAFTFANILVFWGFYNLPGEAVEGFLSLGVTIGSTKITVGLALTAVAILYGSFLVSWGIQTVFMDELLRRRHVESGVRMSMARLVHYVLVLVGFILALYALGFDLRSITILGGALGIGIGFGLQTVVSNFVCGLILLFERPIKVNDVIQLGGELGRVKKLGLRATVVQTFDQAEVVVPNNDLIANQVTNWTLADRQVRLVIPVGVAYGSDIPLVMKSLTEAAEAHTLVLKNPAPEVLFSAFGASSLDFEFRVWITDINDSRKVRSDLLQDIDRRFRELDIEIPFPQQDLHLRSVDDSAAVSLNRPNVDPSKTASGDENQGMK